jgi:hypothetical protein
VTTDRFCAEYDKDGGIRLSCGRGELIATANHTRNDVQGWADRAGGPEWKQKYDAALALLDGRRCPHLDEHHESVERVATVGYEYDEGGVVQWHVAKEPGESRSYASLMGARRRDDGLQLVPDVSPLGVHLHIAPFISDPNDLRKLAAVALSAARVLERLNR